MVFVFARLLNYSVTSHHIGSALERYGGVRLLYETMTTTEQGPLGPVSRKSRKLYGPEKLVVKLQSACFEKMIFLHVFNIRKIKRIAKFEGLEPDINTRRVGRIRDIYANPRRSRGFA